MPTKETPEFWMERWLREQGSTIEELRAPDRHRNRVALRRKVARYLHGHGRSYPEIGLFLAREHSTVFNLVRKNGHDNT